MAKGADVKHPKPTGKRKAADKDEKPQAERFIETARLIESDETGFSFEEAFDKIVKLPVSSSEQ